jgi:hypothetical protein
MVAVEAQDVMDKLLSCEESDQLPEARELNQLIYREDDSVLDEATTANQADQIWTASNDKVTVQVGESRAKIRVKVSQQAHQRLSMKAITDIAVKAITDELKRDTQ